MPSMTQHRCRALTPLQASIQKKEQTLRFVLFSSGGRTRTSGLRVMSPTSYQLLYPAMYRLMVQR